MADKEKLLAERQEAKARLMAIAQDDVNQPNEDEVASLITTIRKIDKQLTMIELHEAGAIYARVKSSCPVKIDLEE